MTKFSLKILPKTGLRQSVHEILDMHRDDDQNKGRDDGTFTSSYRHGASPGDWRPVYFRSRCDEIPAFAGMTP